MRNTTTLARMRFLSMEGESLSAPRSRNTQRETAPLKVNESAARVKHTESHVRHPTDEGVLGSKESVSDGKEE